MKKVYLYILLILTLLLPNAQASFFEGELGLSLLMQQAGLSHQPSLVKVLDLKQTPQENSAIIEDLNLEVLGEKFSIKIKKPKSQQQKLPTLLVFGGLQTGKDSLHFIKSQTPYILISYEYPVLYRELDFKNIQHVLKNLPQIYVQISSLIHWVSQQHWTESINTMGVSFGSLILPLSQRIAVKQGASIKSTILSYGGADLKSFILENNEIQSHLGNNERTILSNILHIMAEPIDPVTHVDQIGSQNLLLVNGTRDEILPLKSVQALHEATTRPHDLLWVEGPHVDVDQPEVLQKLNANVESWLSRH